MKKLSNPLTEDDKAWLRSWNRGDEIPDEDATETTETKTETEGEDPFDGQEPPDDYNDWNTKQLAHELGVRELPKGGNKAELVARLVEDDETTPE